MAVKLSPLFLDPWVDTSGDPLSGYQLFCYANNSSSKQTTYTSASGGVAQANPIIFNSQGRPANPIWLTVGLFYTYVLASPTDTDPPTGNVITFNDIAGINDASLSLDQWVASGLTPTYISATSFSLAGDQTSTFQIGRRLKTTNSGGTVYSRISNSVYGALTTITVVNDSGTLDAGLSAVSYGLLSPLNTSAPANTTGVLAVEQATTSGTSINFTSIPAWVKQIIIMLKGVSTNGTSSLLLQLGDAGGLELTGYLGADVSLQNAAAVASANYTTGFGITTSATTIAHGSITLNLENATTNSWIASGIIASSEAAGIRIVAGSKSLSATLDRLTLTTVNGTDAFDAGAVNITYR